MTKHVIIDVAGPLTYSASDLQKEPGFPRFVVVEDECVRKVPSGVAGDSFGCAVLVYDGGVEVVLTAVNFIDPFAGWCAEQGGKWMDVVPCGGRGWAWTVDAADVEGVNARVAAIRSLVHDWADEKDAA